MKITIETKGKSVTKEVEDWAFGYMRGSSKMLGDILKDMQDEIDPELAADLEDREWKN